MHAMNASTWYEIIGSIFAILMLSLMTYFCIMTPVLLFKKKDVLKDPVFIAKYGSLMQDMNTEDSGVRYYYMAFMIRRLIFSSLIVFMVHRPWA